MAGIYIHIPFCHRKCSYCNFYFSTSLRNMKQVINAIQKEIENRKTEAEALSISTLYLGGGTPSLIDKEHLLSLWESLYTHYTIAQSAEITIEMNPEDVNSAKLTWLRNLGVNRISLGTQSFQNELLSKLGRVHTKELALASIRKIQDAGFENISLDLIYGIGGQTDEMLLKDLQLLHELNIQHISAYALTIEEKTKLQQEIRKGKLDELDEEQALRQFQLIQQNLSPIFTQYEISNWAKIGFESKHNSSYWNRTPYLGFGPSAHSFVSNRRRWNVSSNMKYVKALESSLPYFGEENLSVFDACNETIMTSLRTRNGLDLQAFQLHFGNDLHQILLKQIKLINEEIIQLTPENLRIKEDYLFYADGIASSLFFVSASGS